MYHVNPKSPPKADKDRNVLKLPWKNFALRAQNVQRPDDTPAIIQMTVLVGRDGNPRLWTQPKVILLEPRIDFDVASLNEELTPEQLLVLLDVVARSG